MTQVKVVDTDVLIDFLRGVSPAVDFVTRHADAIVISSVSVAELYAGVRVHERETLDTFQALFAIAPVGHELARVAGLLRRDYGPSPGLRLADAVIAATAQQRNAELVTMNVRHFPMFPDLAPPYTRS